MQFILEFNKEIWKIKCNIDYICKFSQYFKEIIEKNKNSIIFLQGVHLLTFQKIYKFCKHHFNEKNVIFTEWDKNFYITLRNKDSKIDLQDFLKTCNYYEFNDILSLFY